MPLSLLVLVVGITGAIVIPFSIFFYLILYSSLNSSAKDKIGRYQINWQYEKLALQFGLDLRRSKTEFEGGSSFDPDPCEFRFIGRTVNLEVPARIALRILNKMKEGTFDIAELEKKSKCQFIKNARAKE